MDTDEILRRFFYGFNRRNPQEKEFQQAVQEVAQDIIPFIAQHPKYHDKLLLERLTEPDRIISFRVSWVNDAGEIKVNRGFRVQNNNAIGPYKGGMRFQPNVTQSILKFLAFEQTLKNSLTGLPMGGAKGGANFNPKRKSEGEIMRFCQAFMSELFRHIGPDTDIPAGDIGVGAREIGFMFGQLKRLTNTFTGTLTGKGIEYGGSLIRTEATGYGLMFIVEEALRHANQHVEGKRILISGSGNVAIYAAEKALQQGGRILTMSDSDGYIHDKEGIDIQKLGFIKQLKLVERERIKEYCKQFDAQYFPGERPWSVPCDIALPCATQNELDGEDAKALVANGCTLVAEGANMPCTHDAIRIFRENHVSYLPGKASNAGGVAVSGLEMSQNSVRISWSEKELEERLRKIMCDIHEKCLHHGREVDYVNYAKGANIAAFRKVADAMLAFGVV
jgi:glutamate dehydrogenase (NADP+)